MSDIADVEAAERFGKRRVRIFFVQAVFFILWQTHFYAPSHEGALRAVDRFKISAWFVWVLALLLLLATGGALFRSRAVRALLNDELTRRNRTMAYVYGFWAAVGAAIGVYFVAMFEFVSAREAIHIVLSAAIGTAMLTFAFKERGDRAA
ncbi:MAG TPA: hypothetical protein VHM92_06830 [Allosphingosinicella sp.]|nr:hypothetical protein [Allosphingosinicella sp.]